MKYIVYACVIAGCLIVGRPFSVMAGPPKQTQSKPDLAATFEGILPPASPSRPAHPLPGGVESVAARIVPPLKDHGKNMPECAAWLVVEVVLKPHWHIYSMRQKSGGYPTRIEVKPATFPDSSSRVLPGDFLAASPTDSTLFMGNVLEEKKGRVVWLAPIRIEPPIDPVKISQLELRGELDALACSEGNNGVCHPLTVSLIARWDERFDLAPFLAFAEKENQALEAFRQSRVSKESVVSGPGKRATFTWSVLLWAFGGGLLLNVMPCVLPVIGLKIVSFFEQAGQSRYRAFILNLWYAAGMLCIFVSLALMSVGLSYLFTYGLFQIVMSAIVFVMALSLMGLWELRVPSFLGGRKSDALMRHEGGAGAFFKGIITTLLAIPCGAPLLSPALVWSDSMIQQGNTWLVLLVYLVIGLGMAFPYLVVGAFPELLGFLPKPGAWMETFRAMMGFVLLIAVVWILYSMPLPLVLPTITLLFALWFACWFIGREPYGTSGRHHIRNWLLSLGIVSVVILLSFNVKGLDNPWSLENAVRAKMVRWATRAERDGLLKEDVWALFDPARFERELAAGNPVIIDFTADWCMNCKVLESTVLHTANVLEQLERKGIVSMTADWTNQNEKSSEMEAINRLLDRFGGRQVPVIMVFDPQAPEEPQILRGLFTPADLIRILDKFKDRDHNKN